MPAAPSRPRAAPGPAAEPPASGQSTPGGSQVSADTRRDQPALFLLSLLLGSYGVDRFYTGHVVLGLLKLFTLGGCGVWSLVDLLLAGTGLYRDVDGQLPRPQHEGEPRSTCNQPTTFMLSLIALDRFYLGQTALGVLKIVTFGGFGVWWIIDIILTGCGQARDAWGRPLSIR